MSQLSNWKCIVTKYITLRVHHFHAALGGELMVSILLTVLIQDRTEHTVESDLISIPTGY